MLSERPVEKEKKAGVRQSWIRLALSASAFLRWFKISASTILIASFFLPWASQVKGCRDVTVINESISGLSLAVEHNVPEATAAPIIGLVIFILAFLVVGKRRPLLRSIVSLVEAPATFFLTVFIEFGIFFLTDFRERYGFYIAFISLLSISAASLIEVVAHLPLLGRKGRAVIVTILLSLILLAIMSGLVEKG